jgi:hypothetical protein
MHRSHSHRDSSMLPSKPWPSFGIAASTCSSRHSSRICLAPVHNPVVAVREPSLAPLLFGPSLGLLRSQVPHPRGRSPLFPSSILHTLLARPLLSISLFPLSLTVEVVARRTPRTVQSLHNLSCCCRHRYWPTTPPQRFRHTIAPLSRVV